MPRLLFYGFVLLLLSAPAVQAAQAAARKSPPRPVPKVTHTLYLPVAGYVSSTFGPRMMPKMRRPRMHLGIDIHTGHGATVVAAAPGRVIYTGNRGSYGNLIDIDHGQGLVTRYAHLQTILVSPGDTVELGQRIGLVGRSGYTTGPNLHFETIARGRQVDPLPFLLTDVRVVKRAPIRLAPPLKKTTITYELSPEFTRLKQK